MMIEHIMETRLWIYPTIFLKPNIPYVCFSNNLVTVSDIQVNKGGGSGGTQFQSRLG